MGGGGVGEFGQNQSNRQAGNSGQAGRQACRELLGAGAACQGSLGPLGLFLGHRDGLIAQIGQRSPPLPRPHLSLL